MSEQSHIEEPGRHRQGAETPDRARSIAPAAAALVKAVNLRIGSAVFAALALAMGCTPEAPEYTTLPVLEQIENDCDTRLMYGMSRSEVIEHIQIGGNRFNLNDDLLNSVSSDYSPEANPPVFGGRSPDTAILLMCPVTDRTWLSWRGPRFVLYFDNRSILIGIEARHMLTSL